MGETIEIINIDTDDKRRVVLTKEGGFQLRSCTIKRTSIVSSDSSVHYKENYVVPKIGERVEVTVDITEDQKAKFHPNSKYKIIMSPDTEVDNAVIIDHLLMVFSGVLTKSPL